MARCVRSIAAKPWLPCLQRGRADICAADLGLPVVRGGSAAPCASQTFLFLNQKAKSLFHDRKRPAKIAWTVQFRKAHKKVASQWALQPQQRSPLMQRCESLLSGTRLDIQLWDVQDQETQVARKKRRNTSRVSTRSIAGASVEVGTHQMC